MLSSIIAIKENFLFKNKNIEMAIVVTILTILILYLFETTRMQYLIITKPGNLFNYNFKLRQKLR